MLILKGFKENKKATEIKIEKARSAKKATSIYIDFLHNLVKDVSEEDLKEFLQVNDEMDELEDKLAMIGAFEETHKGFDGFELFNSIVSKN